MVNNIVFGVWPSGKAFDFDSKIRRFDSYYPSIGNLAQWLGQLAHNQSVTGSNPVVSTKGKVSYIIHGVLYCVERNLLTSIPYVVNNSVLFWQRIQVQKCNGLR